MLARVPNVVAGERRPPGSDRTYRRLDPMRIREVLAHYPLSTTADVDGAVDAARQAFDGWRRLPTNERGRVLRRTGAVLARRLPEITDLLVREIGKTRPEAEGEVRAAIELFDFYGGESLRFGGEVLPATRPDTHLYTERRPIGVAGLITPWNYPVSIPAWKIGPALLCGNTVVWKPALQHPACSLFVMEALEAAGLPPGVVNLLHGDGDIGAAIVAHAAVAAVSFTGSRRAGEAVYRRAAGRLARASCEMGGKNALVVLADADLDRAVRCAIDGGLSFGGQKCTGTGRIIVERGVRDEFRTRLLRGVERLRVGDPADASTDIGPLVDEAQFERVGARLARGLRDGARLLTPRLSAPEGSYLMAPAVLDGVAPASELAREEVFGPVLCLMDAEDLDHAIALVNDSEYGLSASVCTRSLTAAHRFVDRVETGLAYVNRPTSGAEFNAPFGGVRGSGLGPTEQGLKVLEFYSHWRTVAMHLA